MNTHEKGKISNTFAIHAVIYQVFFGEVSTHFLFTQLTGITIDFKTSLI